MTGRKNKIVLISAVLLLAACLISLIGITYGRLFTTIFFGPVNITAHSGNAVYIFANSLDKSKENGEWTEISNGWTLRDYGATLDFFAVNGADADNFAKRNQSCTVRLAAGLGGESLKVELSYKNSEGELVQAEGVATEIENGTALYSSFGPGTLHRFYDENGEELTFELKGGELSYENFTLTVEGVADLSLINLFVEGEYVD